MHCAPRRLVITLVIAATAVLLAAVVAAGQRPPPGEDPAPAPSGPLTTVEWVGDTITIKGDGGANHVSVTVAEDEFDSTVLTVRRQCTFADQDARDPEADESTCEPRGRVVANEAANGPEASHGCYGTDGNRVECFEADFPRVRTVVVDTAEGDDELRYRTDLSDTLTLGSGDDRSRVAVGTAIDGADGKDILEGGGSGGPGNDQIFGEGNGGPGNDRVTGTSRREALSGGPGNDLVTAFRDGSSLFGNGGSDVLVGGPARDRMNGGPGRDSCDGKQPNPRQGSRLYPQRDRAARCEVVKNVP